MAIGTPVLVGAITSKTATATTVMNVDSAVAAGSLIVLTMTFDANGTLSSITDTAGNTYTAAITGQKGTGDATGIKSGIWYVANASALAVNDSITVTWGTQPAAKSVQALKVSGISTGSPLDKVIANSGTSATPNSGNTGTTTVPNSLIIGYVGYEAPGTDNFTQDTSLSWATPPNDIGTTGGVADTNVSGGGGYYIANVKSAFAYSPTLQNSADWCCFVATFKGADQPLAGSSTLTFSGGNSQLNGLAPIAGSGTIAFNPHAVINGTAPIAGQANLTFTPAGIIGILTQIAGSSTLAFAPAGALSLLAYISGSSTLSFSGLGFLDILRVVVDRIVIEIEAAIDAAGTVSTFYLSTDRFVTGAADTPAHTAFDPRIADPGTIGINAFSDGRTGGNSRLETGEIVLVNVDGGLDAWNEYSFDGRAVTIRGGSVGAYPDDYTTLFIGTVESAEMSIDKAVFRLRDKQWRLNLPALSARYAGTNSLPNGVEGTPDDIQGQVKPKAYGVVFNVSPPLVNTSKLTYEVGACNSIDAVYDQGLAFTAGTTHGTLSALQAATVAAGTVDKCPSAGYFRIGSNPVGAITADVTQGAAAANRTAAQILKSLALAAGFTSGDIADDDITAMDAAASQVIGIWLADESSFQAAMDQIANSVGAWYGFDSSGKLRMGRVVEPASPAITLYDFDVLSGFERRPPKDNGIPVWTVIAHHTKYWTVQPTDLDVTVTNARRAILAHEYRRAAAEDASVKTQWLLAGTMELDTLLVSASAAAAEATRRLALYKVHRDIYDVPITLNVMATYALKVGSVVRLQYPRFGLDSGHDFMVVGVRLELSTNRAILTLWG